MPVSTPKTIIEKIWERHEVARVSGEHSLLYIDRNVLHERSGASALGALRKEGRAIRQPELVFSTLDHVVDTRPNRSVATTLVPGGSEFIESFRGHAAHFGLPLFDFNDPMQGITHVVTPEQGIALPGITLVCADSHTCTVGGVGALAWGVGTTDQQHVLATQTLVQQRTKQMRVHFDGMLPADVSAKDLILYLIGEYGAAGGEGHAVEFTGDAVAALSVESRLTLCNMAVEFGAWTGIVAPDEKTFAYLKGKPFAPKANHWDRAVQHWRGLSSDKGAQWDAELHIDANAIRPQVTWGTSPESVVGIDERIPNPGNVEDGVARHAMERALDYMGLEPGAPVRGIPIDVAFIGSCTNSRLSDLRDAANILRNRQVRKGVSAICVPGSTAVKRAAESEGLDKVFINAGFEWRESGCSLCFFAGGESFGRGKRIVTSTNRNFEHRQGPGNRSHLCSPATVAASAVAGYIADPRELLGAQS